MKRVTLLIVALFTLALASGCVSVVSAQGGAANMTNEAWFTETTGIPMLLPFSTRVYYCPPATNGAATCVEAELIEGGPAGAPESGGGAAGGGAAPEKAPAPGPAPTPPPGE